MAQKINDRTSCMETCVKRNVQPNGTMTVVLELQIKNAKTVLEKLKSDCKVEVTLHCLWCPICRTKFIRLSLIAACWGAVYKQCHGMCFSRWFGLFFDRSSVSAFSSMGTFDREWASQAGFILWIIFLDWARRLPASLLTTNRLCASHLIP